MGYGYGNQYGVLQYGREALQASTFVTAFHDGEHLLRVIFSDPMTDNAALVDPQSYRLQATSGGVHAIATAVVAEDTPQPSYVDLTITELTGEPGFNGYQLSIVSGVLLDYTGAPLVTPDTDVQFAATPFRPYVLSIEPTSLNALDVTFNEDMELNDELRSPSSYVMTGGLVARAVSVISKRKVRIFVTPAMATDQLYSMTVGG